MILLESKPSSFGSSERSESSSVPVNELSFLTKKKELDHEKRHQGSSRCVSFHRSVRQRKISLAKAYPKETKSQLWYSPSECKDLRRQAVATVKKMMKNIDLSDDDCSRGLEFKLPKKNKLRQERKQGILWTVLAEQEDFYSEEDKSRIPPISEIQDHLATVYHNASRKCVLEAIERGKQDALEALGL